MTKKMNAVGYTKYLPIDDPKSLFDFTTDVPESEPHDLLVKVEAVSVNPVDVFTRESQKVPLKDPKIIGWDAVGTVEKVGSKTNRFSVGDRVFYSGSHVRPGCDSEYQTVDERIVGIAPHSLDNAHAAAMPLTSLTAWEAMFEQMNIDFYDRDEQNHNKSILIINGAGGVGSIATQLAHRANLQVISTAGKDETKQWELDHGSDIVVDYHDDIIKQIHDKGFKYVDYILDLRNLDAYWDEICELIAPSGTIVSITGSGKSLDMSKLKEKRARFAWEYMFTKSEFHTPDMITQHEILDKISIMLDEGNLISTLTKQFGPINAENLRKATKLVESKQMIGKVVVANDEK
ncbi:zinc-binding alcohol dehydrogenase family protein [Fructilactobacillus fructivorans]|uniref:Zinc-type alcohol dehydrogenase-like protein n=1 Tax=Fructilactobacillus fructivorans TaxID=1614 RepID=A0AAE6P0R9_9LACO|nr:zinc-binding alcohol dehydrogenase family protein [Fructilactobacillus fructivorans]KRK58234.1 alcohol dehydrogenase, zinc-binding protein [Fructilactobacillus fructivorans]KRN40889.1 alcohol dehydrogenase, zinc-binding protein [Fructilactobacillus fructivorans]KRN42484.1 alcohol dehydrogenase, zinc-binding protein [Fructilactobacillus fructivorans]QFX92222.1 zinc-binding alcohol dehydrogenase family protein [Fructilactobacillus fructivorans]RDV65271.1 zinc-binding alcohol dehydrogenase fam